MPGGRRKREQREASYRRHQESVCKNKIGYHSAQAAKNGNRWFTATRGPDAVEMHAYKCPVCFKWHLTKKTQQ